MTQNVNKQQGIGLPEVMISLLLASLIIIALMNHYISIKQHYSRLQSSVDDAMELQWAGDIIRDSIRQAGFTPCLNVEHLITENLAAIEVDVDLKINRMSSRFNMVLNNSNPSRILLTSTTLLHDDRSVLIADCYHAEVGRVLEVKHSSNGQMVVLANPLIFVYQPPVYVGEWVQERFFIRQSKGLFYQRDHTDELTPLVKNMLVKQTKNLVKVILVLKNGMDLELETRIRGVS